MPIFRFGADNQLAMMYVVFITLMAETLNNGNIMGIQVHMRNCSAKAMKEEKSINMPEIPINLPNSNSSLHLTSSSRSPTGSSKHHSHQNHQDQQFLAKQPQSHHNPTTTSTMCWMVTIYFACRHTRCEKRECRQVRNGHRCSGRSSPRPDDTEEVAEDCPKCDRHHKDHNSRAHQKLRDGM